MDREELTTALKTVLDQLKPLRYRLVGTGAALLQGVQIRTGDIDLLVAHRDDVDRFAAATGTAATWLPEPRQYFAHARLGETEVSMSTVEMPTDRAGFECVGSGPWEHYTEVAVGEHLVPAVALELRLATELVRDRPDRYDALIAHMRTHGYDEKLAETAMRDRGVHPDRCQRVLDELGAPGR
jgi:hypothetical protein